MPSAKKPEITSGQSLDVQPGISNIGENQAALEALRNANIDGQDVYPQSVSTKRFAADDGNFSGIVKSGSMLVGTGGVVVTSDDDGGVPGTGIYMGASQFTLLKAGSPSVFMDGTTGDATFVGTVTATSGTFTGTVNATAGYFVGSITIGTDTTVGGAATGVWLTNTKLLMKYAGATKVDFDTSANTYYVKGELFADKITIASNAANSVDFGSNVTIDGDVILRKTDVSGLIYMDGSSGNKRIGSTGSADLYILHKHASGVIYIHTGSVTLSATPVVEVNSSLNRVRIAAPSIVLTGAVSGVTTLSMSGAITADHKTVAGAQKADGSLAFYAAASGGGSINRRVDITFSNGLITVFTVTAI